MRDKFHFNWENVSERVRNHKGQIILRKEMQEEKNGKKHKQKR